MRDAGINRNHQIEAGDQSGRLCEIVEVFAQIQIKNAVLGQDVSIIDPQLLL